MTGVVLRAAGLLAVYLVVLTSAAPGDVLVGGVLAVAVAVALPPRRHRRSDTSATARASAAAGMLLETAGDMVRGSWRVARFCIGAPAATGFVEVPRGERSDAGVAMWGILTGEAPDEFPVEVDDDRGVLLVHVLDATDPDAVRERHRRAHERRQRKVVP
jgi:multisubunit Na+/H+ antiporter MnhE subunit